MRVARGCLPAPGKRREVANNVAVKCCVVVPRCLKQSCLGPALASFAPMANRDAWLHLLGFFFWISFGRYFFLDCESFGDRKAWIILGTAFGILWGLKGWYTNLKNEQSSFGWVRAEEEAGTKVLRSKHFARRLLIVALVKEKWFANDTPRDSISGINPSLNFLLSLPDWGLLSCAHELHNEPTHQHQRIDDRPVFKMTQRIQTSGSPGLGLRFQGGAIKCQTTSIRTCFQ